MNREEKVGAFLADLFLFTIFMAVSVSFAAAWVSLAVYMVKLAAQ